MREVDPATGACGACVAPTALGFPLWVFPPLPRWAKLFRAYGAGDASDFGKF